MRHVEFGVEWRQVEIALMRYCSVTLRHAAAADHVVQEVRIRAWRGYSTFQRRSTFLTWVLSIARREIARAKRTPRPTVSIDDLADTLPAPVEDVCAEAGEISPRDIVVRAARSGAISQPEADVLLARQREDQATWGQIGAEFGLSAGHCAVLHLRAIRKLRVYAFRFCSELFGGRMAVADAFTVACAANGAGRLTEGETVAFRAHILDELTGDVPRGRAEDLCDDTCARI